MINAVTTVSVQSTGGKTTSSPSVTAADTAVAPVRDANDFVTSRVFIDNLQNAAILQYRDGKTGEVVAQYPSQAQIQAFSRAEQTAAPQQHGHGAETTVVSGVASADAPAPAAPVAASSAGGSSAPATPAPSSSGSGGQSVVV